MNSSDNPFAPASGGSGYTTQNVGFDTGPAPQQPNQPQPAAPAPGGTLDLGGGGGAPAADLIKETTTATFQQDVIAESRNQPVLIDFWAPWCGPCKQLTPIIEAAVRKAGGKVKLVKMNIDDHPAIPGQMGVQSIPAVIAFVDGQPVDGFMGAVPESQVDAFIEKVAGQGGGSNREAEAIDQALAAAKQAAEQGDLNQAAQVYQMILQQVPDNASAYAGLAGLLLDSGQDAEAKQMVDSAPEGIAGSSELASVEARIELAEKVAGLGDPAELQMRVEANPEDYDARFDLAQIKAATGDREGAAEQLLYVMGKDREWREDGARLELLKFFEAWGPTDPATVKARRKLSSMLFR